VWTQSAGRAATPSFKGGTYFFGPEICTVSGPMDRLWMAERLRTAEAEYRRAQVAVSPLDDSSRQRYAAARRELEAAELASQELLQRVQDGPGIASGPPEHPTHPDGNVDQGGAGLER
jgi:hypothetical protein